MGLSRAQRLSLAAMILLAGAVFVFVRRGELAVFWSVNRIVFLQFGIAVIAIVALAAGAAYVRVWTRGRGRHA